MRLPRSTRRPADGRSSLTPRRAAGRGSAGRHAQRPDGWFDDRVPAINGEPAAAPDARGLDLPAVERHLAGVLDLAGPLRAGLVEGGRSNLTYRLTDGTRAWALRRPPLGELTPKAHDMAREYRVMAALADTRVPVPPTVHLCEDPSVTGAPFSLTRWVDGRVITTADDARSLTETEARNCSLALVDTLTALHDIEPAAVGLADFGRAEGFLGRQVRLWWSQWERVRFRDVPGVERLHEQLAAVVPDSARGTILHGDFRLDNTIVATEEPGRIRAVVDWEMAALGHPTMDVAVLCAYWDEDCAALLGGSHAVSANPGFLSADAMVAAYETATGGPVDDLRFCQGLAFFKLAVIAEGIHARHTQGNTVGTGFDRVGEATEVFVAKGLEQLA